MKQSYGKFAATHCNPWSKFTPTGEVAMNAILQRASQRFNQNFQIGHFAIYDKTRPVKILNALTRELLVVQFYDRLDTPICSVWARLVDTLQPYQFKRKVGVTPDVANPLHPMDDFSISTPTPLDNEWW